MFAFVCVFRIGPFTHSRMGCSKAQEALDLQSFRFSTVCLFARLVCLLSVPFEFAARFSHSLLLLIPGSCFSRLPERWQKGIIRRGESNIRQVGFGPDGCCAGYQVRKVFLGRPQGQKSSSRPKLRWQDAVKASEINAGIKTGRRRRETVSDLGHSKTAKTAEQ